MNNKKGFTLVELSIVLVIIGLLIGGILIGQSMIKTARINGMIRKLSYLDAAVNNYKTRYSQLPGDSTFAGGNNDGFVNDPPVSTVFEYLAVWSDLSSGVGLVDPTTGLAYPYNLGTCPYFNYDNANVKTECIILRAATFGGITKNYFQDWGPRPNYTLPVDSQALDTKMDDGAPWSGRVMESNGSASCVSGGKYVLTSKAYMCHEVYELGAASGGDNN